MQNLGLLKQVAARIQNLLGDQCEVFIDDFSDLERSTADVEGRGTVRSIGSATADVILAQIRRDNTEHDICNTLT